MTVIPTTDREELEGREELDFLARLAQATRRRTFLKWSGVTLAVAAVGAGCDDDDDDGTGPPPGGGGVNLGTGDTAILNYAYALEQLEAAFYIRVAQSFYTGITAPEQAILTDIRDHEIVHRNFFKAALGSAAIADLEVTFASVNFTQRASVLGTAKVFEDLGVAAYNCAGKLIAADANLVVAGKIVSVEARHAAAIRDLLNPKSRDFAGNDVVNAQGLDVCNPPATVLAAADPFIVTQINASGIPSA